MGDLARDYAFAGRPDRALPLFEQAWAGRRAKLGPDHPDTLRSMSDLAGAYEDAGNVEKARELDKECLAAHARLNRPESFEMARAQTGAGSRLLGREKWAEAEPLLRAGPGDPARTSQPDAWATDDARSLLGAALARPAQIRRGPAAPGRGLRGDEGPPGEDSGPRPGAS